MGETFDAYHKWLGIPPDEQPPNAYRLLGISLFESDPDVIIAAADQRMIHLRARQISRHSVLSQQLLNEVAAAKLCLLKPLKRAEYDNELRGSLQSGAGAGMRQTGPQSRPTGGYTSQHVRVPWLVGLLAFCVLAVLLVVTTTLLMRRSGETASAGKPIASLPPETAQTIVKPAPKPMLPAGSRESTGRPVRSAKAKASEKPTADIHRRPPPRLPATSLTGRGKSGQDSQGTMVPRSAPRGLSEKQEPPVLTDVVERVEPALVKIKTDRTDGNRAQGSGFVVRADGTIVTNYHVIRGATRAEATFQDRLSAKVTGFVAADQGRDIRIRP